MKRLAIVLAASAALTAGCSSTPPPHFYSLSPAAAQTAARPGPAVSVTASVPDMLDRPQFVVAVSANEVSLLEQHRWAGPLAGEIGRTIAQNLSRATGNPYVLAYPQAGSLSADYRVMVDIQRFSGKLDGEVEVEALWSVRAAQGSVLHSGRASARETSGKTYDTLVAAYNRALGKISSEIAPTVKALPPVKR
jgi:uncharacterized lipoprotein YmbA